MDTSEDLNIIEMGDHRPEINFSKVQCLDHAGQSYSLVCQTSDSLVCPTGLNEHKKQDFIEIEDAYNKNGKLLNKIITIEKIDDTLTDEKAALTDERAALTDEKAALTDERAALTDERAADSGDEDKCTICLNELDTTEQDLRKLLEEDKDELATYKSEENKGEKFNISEVEQFTTGLNMIHNVLPDSIKKDRLWINAYRENIFHNIQLKDNYYSIVSNTSGTYIDMTFLSDTEILLAAAGKSSLQILNTRDNTIAESAFDIGPLLATTIHITKNKKVIIGAMHTNHSEPGRVAVIMMNLSGNTEAIYELDQNNKPIFAYPRNITTTANGNIHVVDFSGRNDDHGKVVVITALGDFINTYAGLPETNEGKPFKPVGILTTPSDHTMVSDGDSDTLHILDNTGQLLTTYNTKDKGIMKPLSLALLDNVNLYIGCTTPKSDTKKNAKFYKVKVSGLYW